VVIPPRWAGIACDSSHVADVAETQGLVESTLVVCERFVLNEVNHVGDVGRVGRGVDRYIGKVDDFWERNEVHDVLPDIRLFGTRWTW
jgi:uncharacterized protein (UPF0128 family)